MPSHRNQVAIEGGPSEFATNPLASWAMPIAGLIFNSHHGLATTNASNPAFHCKARDSTHRRPTASQNAKTSGSTITTKDAFANIPRPIAKPRPIQLLQ